jgi:dipeptidase E
MVTTPYNGDVEFNLEWLPAGSDVTREGDKALGLVDFTMRVHVDREGFSTSADVEKWAAEIPVPTYAIDDETAIRVTDGTPEVVSEGNWKLFPPR